jgi:integrase
MPARPVGRRQRPWNEGLLVGQKKPLEPKHVWSIRVRLEIARSKRDLAIFNLAIDNKLRGCDLVKLRLEDICSGTNVRRRATIVQRKTGRPVQFEISEQSKNSVEAWLPMHRTQVRNISSPADFMQVLIFQPANMPGWCIAGLKASA